MKGSVSIALFFLLSGFFLTVLLGAIEHSGKLLAISAGCLAGIVCIIIFLTPVEWSPFRSDLGGEADNATAGSAVISTTSSTIATTTTLRHGCHGDPRCPITLKT